MDTGGRYNGGTAGRCEPKNYVEAKGWQDEAEDCHMVYERYNTPSPAKPPPSPASPPLPPSTCENDPTKCTYADCFHLAASQADCQRQWDVVTTAMTLDYEVAKCSEHFNWAYTNDQSPRKGNVTASCLRMGEYFEQCGACAPVWNKPWEKCMAGSTCSEQLWFTKAVTPYGSDECGKRIEWSFANYWQSWFNGAIDPNDFTTACDYVATAWDTESTCGGCVSIKPPPPPSLPPDPPPPAHPPPNAPVGFRASMTLSLGSGGAFRTGSLTTSLSSAASASSDEVEVEVSNVVNMDVELDEFDNTADVEAKLCEGIEGCTATALPATRRRKLQSAYSVTFTVTIVQTDANATVNSSAVANSLKSQLAGSYNVSGDVTSDTVATITIVAKGTSEDAQMVLSSNFTSSSISQKVSSDLGIDESALTVSEPVAVFPPRPPPSPPPRPPLNPPGQPPPPPQMVITFLDNQCAFPIIQVEGANNAEDARITRFRRTAYVKTSSPASAAFDADFGVLCAHSSEPPLLVNNRTLVDVRLTGDNNVLTINGMVARQYVFEVSTTSYSGASSEWNVVSSEGDLSSTGCFSPPSQPPPSHPPHAPPSPPPSPTPSSPPPKEDDNTATVVLITTGVVLGVGGVGLVAIALYMLSNSGSSVVAAATAVAYHRADAQTPLLVMKADGS